MSSQHLDSRQKPIPTMDEIDNKKTPDLAGTGVAGSEMRPPYETVDKNTFGNTPERQTGQMGEGDKVSKTLTGEKKSGGGEKVQKLGAESSEDPARVVQGYTQKNSMADDVNA